MGQDPLVGSPGGVRGQLVSPTAGLCYGDITTGEWHKDGCIGTALSLPWVWAVPRCPRLVPRFCGAFGGSGKFKLPFLGRLDQREAVVRLSRGCGSSGMQMSDLTTGRRAGASKYPPAIHSSVRHPYFKQGNNPTYIFMQRLPGDVGRYREALGRAGLKVWEQHNSVPP